jgi:type I site-specific restriction-modification system R (restriction) subunit
MGAGAVLVAGYGWYHFSGVKTAVQTAKTAKGYVDYGSEQLKASLSAATPDSADDVISKLKEVANSYAGWVPGGKAFVDKSFKDLEAIQEKHGDEVNKIVKATYEELREVSQKKGASMETANDVWTILSRRFQELGALAGDAAQQIVDNHPEIKKRVGGSIDQLKDLGDRYGPEAKKKVDETFAEVSSIAKGGLSIDTADKIRKLVQEKVEEIKKMGEDTWNKALEEQIKPALEKNPQVKKLVEENMDTLKNGNISEAVSKVSKAVSSGDTKDLENWVKE